MRISVIIPSLDEEANIAATLQNVRAQQPHEIVVIDGGSSDRTAEIAAPLADRFLVGQRGRAAQMNLGAESAAGDALLFLHADCTLAAGAIDESARLLEKPAVAAGCFTMHVPLRNPLYRCIESSASARTRLFGIIYGDQGLFIRHKLFEHAGGFPKLQLMEDVYLSLRLRKMGRIVVANRQIVVSPRRWQKAGLFRQTLRNWALTALAAAGVHPDRLAAYYTAVR
jgi:rSAM/selenodomain-associated transferase 2